MPTRSEIRRKKKQKNQIAAVLVAVFLTVTIGASGAAFLLRDDADNKVLDSDLPAEQQEENPEQPDETAPEAKPVVPDEKLPEEEENPEVPEESIPEPEEGTTEPEQEKPEDETESPSESEEPEIPVEPEPIVFRKPDVMRGVVVTPGEDFLTNPQAEPAQQQKEIDTALQEVSQYKMNTIIIPLLSENGTVFSIDSIQSVSTFDGLQYLMQKAKEQGLFVYGIYDLSLYADGGSIAQSLPVNTETASKASSAFADFVKKYDMDGILLDGYVNTENGDLYKDYMIYGAGRTFQEYAEDTSRMLMKSAKDLISKYSQNTQVGLLTSAEWIPSPDSEEGSAESAESEKEPFLPEGTIDFMAVKNFTATGDSNAPFEEAAAQWDTLAEKFGAPVYTVHAADRACTTEISPGWAAHDQLTRQMIALENCRNLQGSIFNSLHDLAANPKDSTTLLMDYFSNNVKKEHVLKELAFSKPTQLQIATTDKTYTFQGASDPNSPVTVNSEKIDTDENGFFAYTVELEPGDNTYTFTHKEKTMTFTISRQVQVLKEVTPAGSLSVDGGMKVSVTAIAYENSTVFATINGQNYPLQLDEMSGDEKLRGTSYRRYTGSFTAPKSTKEIQKLGNIVVTATWEGITKTMEGASVTVNKLAVVEDGVLVRITADQASVFPVNEIGKYPTPSCYRLPQGTLDYAVGDEVIYKDGEDIRKYYKLASGMRVYSSDLAAVTDSDLVVAGNIIHGLTVKADQNFTYVTLESDLPVPFIPAYSSTKFQIDFKYTTGVPDNLSLSKNPLFNSATWNDTVLTLELKSQNAFLGYKAWHEKGKIVFRFNNPTKIGGARIVVDPGHGGGDNGAAGFNPNFNEKDINWAIAKKLASELEDRGANVLLLKTINQTTSMDARLAAAHDFNAQIFISVHHNSAPSTATGTEAYYFYPFAQPLASKMSANTSSALNTNNRGSKYDVFYVTRDPAFVGILSEGGFLTNRKEYKKLLDEDYQWAVASEMADAVASFLKGAGSENAGITGTEHIGSETPSAPDSNPDSSVPDEEDSNDTSSQDSIIDKIVLEDSEVTLDVDEIFDLQYTVSPESDVKELLEWVTSDPSVVKVNGYGKLRGISSGTATITVRLGNVSASCKVTVR